MGFSFPEHQLSNGTRNTVVRLNPWRESARRQQEDRGDQVDAKGRWAGGLLMLPTQ